MTGGWDNHPEYGGPEPTWREAFVIALVIVAIAGLILLALNWNHPLRLGCHLCAAPSLKVLL
jgi:hypothetical protein